MAMIIPDEKQPPKQTTIGVRMEEYRFLHARKNFGQPMHDILRKLVSEYEWQKNRIAELEHFQEEDKKRKQELREENERLREAAD